MPFDIPNTKKSLDRQRRETKSLGKDGFTGEFCSEVFELQWEDLVENLTPPLLTFSIISTKGSHNFDPQG